MRIEYFPERSWYLWYLIIIDDSRNNTEIGQQIKKLVILLVVIVSSNNHQVLPASLAAFNIDITLTTVWGEQVPPVSTWEVWSSQGRGGGGGGGGGECEETGHVADDCWDVCCGLSDDVPGREQWLPC